MTTVISVRFRSGCKTYFFDPGDVQVQTGDHVIVETAQGLEYAQCTMGNHPVDDCCVIQPLRPMVPRGHGERPPHSGPQPRPGKGSLRHLPEEDPRSTSWR